MSWFCYIIECKDKSLYTGVTENLNKRIEAHRNKSGARYTAKHLPVKLLWFKKYQDRKEALRKEKEIKGWRREKKMKFIKISPSS